MSREPRRILGRDDEGLSSVLGAILLFGLLVSTLVTVQVEYVPVWDHQREAQLMDTLGGQFAQLRSDLVRQVGNRSVAPTTVPLTLAPPGGFTFFTGTTAPGEVSFQPAAAGRGLSLTAPRLTLVHTGETETFVLNETWRTVTNTTVAGVEGVDHLRIRIASPEALGDNQRLTLTVTDADGRYAGKLVVLNKDVNSEYALSVLVYSAANATQPITEVLDGWKKHLAAGDYYVNALDPTLGFSAVLSAAISPVSLTWQTTMRGVREAMVYTSNTQGRVGAAGIVIPNYSHLTDGGRVHAERDNQEFPSQRLTLEYGAILVRQPDGAAMAVPPPLSVRVAGGQAFVSWAAPELTGVPAAVQGSRTAQVTAAPLGPRVDLRGFAPRLGLTLATDSPQVWVAHLDGVLRDAGLDPAAGHYALSSTANSVTLDLRGPLAAPADPTNDITLDFVEATLALSVLPTG